MGATFVSPLVWFKQSETVASIYCFKSSTRLSILTCFHLLNSQVSSKWKRKSTEKTKYKENTCRYIWRWVRSGLNRACSQVEIIAIKSMPNYKKTRTPCTQCIRCLTPYRYWLIPVQAWDFYGNLSVLGVYAKNANDLKSPVTRLQ